MNRSTRKITTIYLVMFALIFNAVTSSVAYGSMGQNGVLLCTSQGYKWLEVESETNSLEQAQQHCKLCLFPPSDDNSDYFIANSGPFSIPSTELGSASSADHQPAIIRFTYPVAQSRAPPFNTSTI